MKAHEVLLWTRESIDEALAQCDQQMVMLVHYYEVYCGPIGIMPVSHRAEDHRFQTDLYLGLVAGDRLIMGQRPESNISFYHIPTKSHVVETSRGLKLVEGGIFAPLDAMTSLTEGLRLNFSPKGDDWRDAYGGAPGRVPVLELCVGDVAVLGWFLRQWQWQCLRGLSTYREMVALLGRPSREGHRIVGERLSNEREASVARYEKAREEFVLAQNALTQCDACLASHALQVNFSPEFIIKDD